MSTSDKIWNISEERNPHFTGRDEELGQVHEALTAGKTAALPQIIRGSDGVGKTQMALEYAYRHASDYDGIWFLHAEEPVTLAREYAELATRLGLAVEALQSQVVRAVCEKLSQSERVLLIFDNAIESSTLEPYLPSGTARRVIVTTQAESWPEGRMHAVDSLPVEVAAELLCKRTGQADKQAALDVAKRLECLPLALEQAAAYCVMCAMDLDEYDALVARRGLAVPDKGRPRQYPKVVRVTWGLAFEDVQSRCPAAAELLCLCAFLSPEAIYLRELALASKQLPKQLAAALSNPADTKDLKAALLAFSLIRADKKTVAIHRLVSYVNRQRMTPREREQWLGAALATVNALVPSNSDDARTWATCSHWLVHALTVVNCNNADIVDAGACARILSEAAGHLWSKGDYQEAEPLYRRALAIDEQTLGPSHPDVALRLNNLAALLQGTNRLSEAEPLYRRALAIDEESLGPAQATVASDLANLAALLRETHRALQAEPLYRRALAIDEQILGPSHPKIGVRLSNLAGLLKDMGRWSEAEPLYRRALAIDEETLGPAHPEVALRLGNLAALLEIIDRVSEAELLYRRAVDILESSLGKSHPSALKVRKNLESLLAEQVGRQQ